MMRGGRRRVVDFHFSSDLWGEVSDLFEIFFPFFVIIYVKGEPNQQGEKGGPNL